MLVLITYDVNTADAAGANACGRSQAVRQLRPAVQNSVFECKLDPAQYKLLQAKAVRNHGPRTGQSPLLFPGKSL